MLWSNIKHDQVCTAMITGLLVKSILSLPGYGLGFNTEIGQSVIGFFNQSVTARSL